MRDCNWSEETPDACPYCAGEACNLCGPQPRPPCDHDSFDRHLDKSDLDAPNGRCDCGQPCAVYGSKNCPACHAAPRQTANNR